MLRKNRWTKSEEWTTESKNKKKKKNKEKEVEFQYVFNSQSYM